MNQHTKLGMKEQLFVLIIALTCVCLSLGMVGKARQVKSDSDDLMRLKAREDQYLSRSGESRRLRPLF